MRSLRLPTGGLWSHRDFMKLWTGQSISEFGTQISGLAIPWLAAVGLHATPFEFSLLTVLGFLPFIALQICIVVVFRLLAITVVRLVIESEYVFYPHEIGHYPLEHLALSLQGI